MIDIQQTVMLDDIERKIYRTVRVLNGTMVMNTFDIGGKDEIVKFEEGDAIIRTSEDYPETHHIDYLKEEKDGTEIEEKEDEAKETTETPWAAAEISCKSCLSTCCGFGQKPRRVR